MKTITKLTFLLLIILCFASCKSSLNKKEVVDKNEVNYIPYYLKAYQADSLFLTNNFDKSYRLLDSLFKRYKPLNTQNINEYGIYIASAVMSNHIENIDDKIRYGILHLGSIGFSHPDIDTIQTKIYLKASKMPVEEYKKMYAAYREKNVPKELDTLLVKMYDDDQAALNENNEKQIVENEKTHKKIIRYIFSKYGYPSYNIQSKIQNKEGIPADLLIIMLHQSVKTKKGYLKFLYDNLKKGVVSPFEYSSIVDKIYMEKNLSLYGTISNQRIMYPEKLDSLRKSIGLPRYGYEKWAFEINFPAEKNTSE